MWVNSKRLTEDVRRWRAEGWVTPQGEAYILDDLARRGSGLNLASSLGILASVLLGFAVMSFVAAHWQEMSRLVRLSLLVTLIWAGYVTAGAFASRGKQMFADAAILFSVAAFGASIMLISQMFHIDGNPPDAILAWWLGAFLSGVVLRSNPALAFAMVLVAVWTGMKTGDSGHVHWPFLAAWAAITAAFVWHKWQPGTHISAIALAGFVISLGYTLETAAPHLIVAGIGLAAALAAVTVLRLHIGFDAIAAPALGYAIGVLFAALFALQFIENTTTLQLLIYAAATLALLLAAIGYGLSYDHRGALWLGYLGFSVEVLALYWKTVGTILDTSLFFLVAGLIVAGLAFLAWRLAHRFDGSSAHEQGTRA
ncbi:MAG: DUF2157 domain-containing protein [Hyphomicrobium sp.]